MKTIIVTDYDPHWPQAFEELRSKVWEAVQGVATAIEHVGSTAVPGLAAKPVIDIDVVVRSEADVPAAIQRLGTIGYVHRGNLGVDGREAFTSPTSWPRHHLYLCRAGGTALANHLAVRDSLRARPDLAQEYGELKKHLAVQFPHDSDRYTAGKTDILLRVLREAGLAAEALEDIARANRPLT